VTTGASNAESNTGSNREEGVKPAGEELLRKAEKGAERQLRDFFVDLQKQAARGMSYQAGRKVFDEIVRILSEH